MRQIIAIFTGAILLTFVAHRAHAQQKSPSHSVLEIPADVLEDKIRGGMLGQILGNLNGLPHELKYIDEPGNIESYTPSLPDGARTDDDTDIEWVYLHEIVRSKDNFLPSEYIAALWKRHINKDIWCANLYARGLMCLEIEPPWTGNIALNPWSDFNISGQFVCESFGLMAPGMPQTAAKLGLNYTHVAIDGEPAQATQLFTTMIATAFVENDLDKILDAGLLAVDPKSEIAQIVTEVRILHRANSDDWRATRRELKARWQKQGGVMRDRNGYELNTACTIAAVLYGRKDFVETLRTAFNFGWDADNNAATSATIVGVIRGRRWMNDQGWNIKDIYHNTSRDDMPMNETLTSLEDTLIAAARVTIERNGGALMPASSQKAGGKDGQNVYCIPTEQPANIEPLATPAEQIARAKKAFGPTLGHDLTVAGVARARAAYLAICLGEAEKFKADSPGVWSTAIVELEKYPSVIGNLFAAPKPIGESLRQAAERAGLKAPSTR